jgi:hypothetical protein
MSGDGHARRARRAAGSFGLLDFPRDPNDEYETPVEAVERLLRLETFVGGCWDSSCGRGNILKALCACLPAHEAIVGSDLHEAAMASALRETCSVAFGQDFLAATVMRDGCRNIVINPPFKACDAHIRHALKLLPDDGKLAALLRLNWIAAQKRADLLSRLRSIIIVGRLKMLPPGIPDLGHSGSVDFAWFVFSKADNDGGTRIVRA